MSNIQSPIRKIRNQRGWTISECADRLGIRPGSVGKIELGLINIPVVCLPKLKQLGYDPLEILLEHYDFMLRIRKFRRNIFEYGSNTQAHGHQ